MTYFITFLEGIITCPSTYPISPGATQMRVRARY